MAAPSDNSTQKNSISSSHPTGAGVIVDIGTGDGRFVSDSARLNPDKFYIGIDANAKPLRKISMQATRKTQKGGLPNALFLQAAVEDLPTELNGIADEIHIHFPWGSLLRAVAVGDATILANLRRIAAPECLLEIIIGIDEKRDQKEIARLELPSLSSEYLETILIPKYVAAGFESIENGILSQTEWSKLQTAWARKLQGNENRTVVYLVAQKAET